MICEQKYCTGCFACFNACSNNAIEMVPDNKFGHIYPVIDSSKCIQCKKCTSACPETKKPNLTKSIKCYAAQSKNKKQLLDCSSGGVADIISNHIIQNNGYVAGAQWTKQNTLEHNLTNNMKQVRKFRKSKYAQSNINNTFIRVRSLLNKKITILFIGCPCQVSGLKTFLKKDYSNLITVDLVCHGVGPQKLLKEQLKLYSHKVNNISFRTKEGKEPFVFMTWNDDKLISEEKWNINPYYYLYLKSYIYRDSCYSCKYACEYRTGDITIGDFWGLNINSILYKYSDNGVSLVLINTEKGKKLFDAVKDKLNYEERPLFEAFLKNEQLSAPSTKPKNYEAFSRIYFKNKNLSLSYKKTFLLHYLKKNILKI